MAVTENALAEEFSTHRSHLIAVAYRLTGSVADSEDAVQEAWLRLSALTSEKRAEIQDLRAWLTTVVGRLCLDRLRSATARREHYVGEWLPEPIVTPLGAPRSDDPLESVVRDDGVRMAAMVVLDRLTPEQRVAFVLHDAFSLPFSEIADILGVSPDTARQYGSRGRRALADADPPSRQSIDGQREVLERFVSALMNGDVKGMTEVLHPDVVLIGDSDGRARTTRRIMVGADKIIRFFEGLLTLYRPGAFESARMVMVNGDVGMYVPPAPGEGYRDLDAHLNCMAIRDGRIVAIYDQANPEKLTRAVKLPDVD
ncbi:sigma-70 family RNA polymerase sigma factor [Prauserella cavernicola]|uniref:Sigma-70 family RNA polymerase sigma factor n=1 Tax=Prauserella cavernicola TaxID=2800127 RepID=A0A934V2X7_9PSEU|nr:sigma-70 family RNA polymerase sigma factor [Prauserella cavernicola]MBK1786581.1 sigma-70 family RNA polymerase sigma factor [Prauserella cavernicola]